MHREGGQGFMSSSAHSSVADPWHFGVDPDPWIRIRGSMPLTNGSGSAESFYFHHWPSRCQQKTDLKKSFSAYYFLKVPFSSIFKGKKSKRSHKSVEIMVFLTICFSGAGSGSVPLANGSGSGRPKNTWIRWIRIRISNTGAQSWLLTPVRSGLMC